MVADIKQLIRPDDIRTMQKDIKQLKKTGLVKKPTNTEIKEEQEKLKKILSETAQHRHAKEQLKTDTAKSEPAPSKSDSVIELKNKAQDQQIFQENNAKSLKMWDIGRPPIAKSESSISGTSGSAEPKDKIQAQQLKSAVSQKPPAELIQAKPLETKKEVAAKAATPENKEGPKPISKDENEKRRKFLEDIEQWANSN